MLQSRERKKKAIDATSDAGVAEGGGLCPDSLAAFHERLQDLCKDDIDCHGQRRDACIRAQAKHAVAVAAELGILKEAGLSWEEFLCEGALVGAEHMVELDERSGVVGKTTIPPGFGLIPKVRSHKVAAVGPASHQCRDRHAIEFDSATPLEYLSRWQASNEVFGDDVRLVSVIQWDGGMVSFGISQPQYHGVPAEARDIEKYFREAGWQWLNDSSGHQIYFNYAFDVLAFDAARRNCYINSGGLQPFDVILCHPSESLRIYLGI